MGSVIPAVPHVPHATSHLPNIFLPTRGSWYLHLGLRDEETIVITQQNLSERLRP